MSLAEVETFPPVLRDVGNPTGANVSSPNSASELSAIGGIFSVTWCHSHRGFLSTLSSIYVMKTDGSRL
jgi:hypothetical protein